MKLQIQSIHFDADRKLLEYIQQKCDKLDTFFDRIVDGQVFLKAEKVALVENKVVEIKLNVPNDTLVATENGVKFEEAVDLATDNLKRQIKRYKERLREH
ncbi:MAG: ribosome-associated translation inhibitor RaiA [Bacteroidia bacterium]|nr:ribosome-associated translation inhibitor RaiA [Bacteroidia bacterium]